MDRGQQQDIRTRKAEKIQIYDNEYNILKSQEEWDDQFQCGEKGC